MASLKFIMDINDDHQTDARQPNKKDKDSGLPVTSLALTTGQQLYEASPTGTSTSTSTNKNTKSTGIHNNHPHPPPHPRHVSSSSGLAIGQNINQPAPATQNKRRGASARGPKLAASSAATASPSSSSSLSLPLSLPAATPSTRPPARRPSTASNDSMDPTGYGSAASSSSMGAGGMHPSNTSMRPMPSHTQSSDVPMRLTPITGRVSRAKKGVPVHICDICKPTKTFTRAEHLRRHQLSHQRPGYPCTYPGCERAFHRPDLLARHQQRHEQEGDKVSSRGGGDNESRRASSAPLSINDPSSGPGAQSSSTAAPSVPPTPNPPASQSGFPVRPVRGSSPLPSHHGASSYPQAGDASNDYRGFPSPTMSIQQTSLPAAVYNMPYQQSPRTMPPSICVVTQGLQNSEPPELYHQSPWAASSTDSTYSTPSDSRYPRYWPSGAPTQLLSSYPNPRPQADLPSPSTGIEITPRPVFTDPFSSPGQHFNPSFSMVDTAISNMGGSNHHPMLGGSSGSHLFLGHHQHGNPISPVRSPTPPPNTSSHSETLVIPSPALPSRLDAPGRHKGGLTEVHQDVLGTQGGMGGIGMFTGHSVGFGSADASPGGGNGGNHHGMGILTDLNLPVGGGGGECGVVPGLSMASLLPRQVLAAIPGYLDTYWARVHPLFPLVHRASFEAVPEDFLRCAMAAVATQYLPGKEDRIRGSQLHEYAVQEVKRIPQWSSNVQAMQAILLCEYFSRFRGRKAITRPSKLFVCLYWRVSSSQSPPSDNEACWLVDATAWSPNSSPTTSDCSSFSSLTPTTTAMSFSQQNFSVMPSTPWSSFPSSYASSASSPFGNSSLSPASSSSLTAEFLSTLNQNNISFSYDGRLRARQLWSSLFAPSRYSPSTGPSLSSQTQSHIQTQSQVAEQAYSQCLSNPQILYHPAMFDEAGLDSDSVQDRWHRWVEADAYRRLLAACFFVDGHAAIFQQQRRAHECDISGMAPLPQMPLFGRSSKLWEAFSARKWAELLSADPEAGIPTYVPPPDQLTPEYVLGLDHFDCKVALSIEVLRLPSRQMTPTASASGHSSPISDADPHMQHVGSQFNPDQQPHFQHAHQLDPQDLSIDAEQRISALFRTCPTANVYLALHHTPLQDLLAVGGDSWIFSKKVLPATSFAVHQKRLKAWTEQHQRLASNNNYADAVAGLSAAKATMYAARAIVGYIQRAQPGTGLSWTNDLSDYWGLYVCALICWAFAGHRMRGTSTASLLDPRPARQRRGSNGGGSGGSSPTSRASGNSGNAAAAADEEAMGWLQMAAADGMRPEDVVWARGRSEALGVVGLVRRRLENDCVGSRSRLYVDAVVVLRKLEEGANWN
ncbi:hypothetical protein B0T26DRAFT_759104 [Lasiosphaeria miniovina]|uniref:C2H2-type domain-containing protein n=1 Tax=Lasiosphaeria miniovina TaxID=1954250 RepID=A0AA40E9H0_9PEZI|nr:uncharacterized protein B0T26DRAFT_759104 [Lasiosphaeria miniovina]KAK0733294.1 hypothetical protein B0T26DRAFT_759104 [Lasiosphaeria miniovina]